MSVKGHYWLEQKRNGHVEVSLVTDDDEASGIVNPPIGTFGGWDQAIQYCREYYATRREIPEFAFMNEYQCVTQEIVIEEDSNEVSSLD